MVIKIGNQTFLADSYEMTVGGPLLTHSQIMDLDNYYQQNIIGEISGVPGCTDESAYNYNSEATYDDGSCYNLDWNVEITDCNMTILINETQIVSGDISLNDGEIPNGSMLGVFYENSQGQLVCGGLSEPWENTSTAVPVWGSESGLDNGFQVGEEIAHWFLLLEINNFYGCKWCTYVYYTTI